MKRVQTIDEKLLSGPSAARALDLDPATIRRWRKEGAPCHLMGDLVRYKLSELTAWRTTRTRVEPPAPEEKAQAKPDKNQSAKEAVFAARMREIAQNLKLLPALKSLLLGTQKLVPAAEWSAEVKAQAKSAIVTLKQIIEILEEIQ
jgi:hypothetical protein